MKLPELPKVELETLRDEGLGRGGFLALRRMELATVRGAMRSAGFPYDMVERRALDAAVMVAHHVAEGRVWVWLRSSVRPPLALRPIEPRSTGVLWEVPAGLIEPGETPVATAARELAEELGFVVDEAALTPLGPGTATAPAFIAEMQHYFHVRVVPETRGEPGGDGSALESAASIISVPLDDAIAACRAGEIPDAKSEIALRRLAELFP